MSTPAVLLVEDEELLRSSLKRLLERNGYEVVARENGRLALETLDRADREGAAFDIVLSDVRMPDMDGLALLERVKLRHPRTPVVLMTAFGERDVMRAALEASLA